jgi:hypothetical protein
MTAPVRAPVDVVFRATGVEQVRNGLKLVSNEASGSHEKVARGAQTAANAIAEMARSGEMGGRGIRELVKSGAEMSMAFGAGGPVIGALGLLGVAVYNHITNRMKEAREEIRKTKEDLAGFSEGHDLMSAAKLQQYTYSGNPFAVQKEGESDERFRARQLGIEGMEREIAEMRRKPDVRISERGEVLTGETNIIDPNVIARAEAELKKLKATYDLAKPAVDALTVRQGQMDATGLKLAQEEAEKKRVAAMEELLFKRTDPAGTIARGEWLDQFKNLGIQTGASGSMIETRHLNVEPHDLVPKIIKPSDRERIIAEFNEQVQQPLGNAIRSGMASTIGSAIADGITAGFEHGGITGAFKAGGKAILAGLGGIITQMGEVWVSYGISMTTLGQALWNPLTSGPAAIAIGASLIALGSAVGAVAHHGAGGAFGGGSSYASSLPQIIDRGLINPANGLMTTAGGLTARTPVNVTIIGANDPNAQRQITELIRNADRRGGV